MKHVEYLTSKDYYTYVCQGWIQDFLRGSNYSDESLIKAGGLAPPEAIVCFIFMIPYLMQDLGLI